MKIKGTLYLASAGVIGALLMNTLPAWAQTDATGATTAAGQSANQVVNNAGTTVNGVTNQLPGTLSAVGNTTGNVVNGLQPTLQPIGQGVGGALNNLTQPDNISALLEFLSSIVPNHIEAHVNLDALRVEKLTVDVRGVDLRNLKVDLLVANSRNAGAVRPAMSSAGRNTGTNLNLSPSAGSTTSTAAVPYSAPSDGANQPTTR